MISWDMYIRYPRFLRLPFWPSQEQTFGFFTGRFNENSISSCNYSVSCLPVGRVGPSKLLGQPKLSQVLT
jgi:hypothetical protein